MGLTNDEALVLFDFLSRLLDDKQNLNFTDIAEDRLLNDILAMLERILSEPFSIKYKELLSQAKDRIKAIHWIHKDS